MKGEGDSDTVRLTAYTLDLPRWAQRRTEEGMMLMYTLYPESSKVARRRAAEVLMLLKKEIALCKLQAHISKSVEEKIGSDQRKYFLMEQLRSIKKELGLEKDDKSALLLKCAPN